MSLQVWIPMTGSINNQGLSNVSASVTGVSSTTSGKIANNCANFASGNYIKLSNIDFINKKNPIISIAFWLKTTSTSTMTYFCDRTNTGDGISIFHMNTTLRFDLGGAQTSLSHGANFANWTHVCLTADGKTKKLYINGVLKASADYTNAQVNIGDAITIGGSSPNTTNTAPNTNYFVGQLQDYRIYDHALSQKEVRELSKGLAAHYQLKGIGTPNFLEGSGKYILNSPLVRNASDVSNMSDSYKYYDTTDLKVVITTAGTYTFVVESDGTPSTHKTTGATASERRFSMWLHDQSANKHYIWTNPTTAADGRHYGTMSLAAGTYRIRTNLYASDNVDYTVKIWNMKVIQGEFNPKDNWCPHTNDAAYTSMAIADILGTDTSGFGNHLNTVGTPIISSDSTRYENCIDFNQAGYLRNNFGLVTTAFTVSFWINMPASTDAQHFVFGTHDNWTNNGFSAWRDVGKTAYSVLMRSSAESAHLGVSLAPTAGEWTHAAYVYTGTELIHYRDGVEIYRKTYGLNGTVSHPVMYLGNSTFNGAATSEIDESMMSDFRFYATALSADDVANLYKSAAAVDNEYNFYTYELNEAGASNIKKNGMTNFNSFSDTAPIHDMKLMSLDDGSAWARIHWLDVSSTSSWFTTAEVAECSAANRYSRMGIVDKFKSYKIPEGYTKIEYIESNGTQVINTDYYWTSEVVKIEMDATITSNSASQSLFGNEEPYSGGRYFSIVPHGTNGTYGYYVGSNSPLVSGIATCTVGTRFKLECETNASKLFTVKVNGTLKTSATYSGTVMGYGNTTSTNANRGKIYIFSNHNSGSSGDSPIQQVGGMRLYSFKMYDNGALVRDFIPVKKSDGTVGLFDMVNQVFHGNIGTGTFAAGGVTESQEAESGVYEFLLKHPRLSATNFNRWRQASSPNDTVVVGLQKLNTAWNTHFGGIRKGTSGTSVYNCDTGGTWFAPIGQTAGWTNASIPGADGSQQKEIELWVRIDLLPNQTKFDIYQKFISAKNFIEL